MTEHRYTQYMPDSTYWDKEKKPTHIGIEPPTEVTWVGENGLTWTFIEEEDDEG